MDKQSAENKENIIYIESLSDFLNEINKIGKEEKEENTLFYRGHSDQTYELKPSIYRDERFIENEDKIYRETISKVPYDFKGKNTIESLVLMQHYGVPTRILDLTTNPLVALYFACIENKDKDGEVVVFDIPEESTCYFDSDKVTILANLAKCKIDFKYKKKYFPDLKKHTEIIRNLYIEKSSQKCSNKKKIISFIESKKDTIKEKIGSFKKENLKDSINSVIDELTNEYKKINSLDLPDSDFLHNELLAEISIVYKSRVKDIIVPNLNNYYFSNLLHYIREDKSHFKPIIDAKDVGSIFAIKPKLDNPRIIRQHGAFLIFGAKENNKEIPKVEDHWIIAGKNARVGKRIIIDNSKKESILTELDRLGINKSTLFPEIDKVADYIKEKYTQK
nr:FRG domain-containing protein [uncultured Capnocytophaga sp.]